MSKTQNINHKIEILAPAGSYDSFRAAIAAGADAVYAGGPRFGARAYAENFTEETLLEAIDYAHLHGRKFYLTVNTLFKEQEIAQLHDYLEPLYLGGLDAVIVQDLGVFEYVHKHFPKMDLHVSTQMTVTGAEGAQFLKEKGAARVVPARELSLEEVHRMKETTGMEMECFVHGALCYCYSGQCLLSSMIGGRSGNRGQCAQPCRLPYTVHDQKAHWLSPKDICTLELIPDLIEAGIDSFKIEGRMKRPEYVAGVTAMYRKYVDLYLKKGRKGFFVLPEDKEILMDLYNRGGFNNGYYKQHNGKNMMSTKRPNHAGVEAVQVTSQKGREVMGRALTNINKGDVLELLNKQDNYTFGKEYKEGSSVMILVPKGKSIRPGTILYRTKNEQLLTTLSEQYVFGKIKEKIYGFLTLSVGEPAKLVLCFGNVSVEAESDQIVETASKSPLDEARIRKQLLKTGNTEFEFEQLEIVIEGDIFLPMNQLNELRRKGLEALQEAVCKKEHRSAKQVVPKEKGIFGISGEEAFTEEKKLHVLVEKKEQLQSVAKCSEVRRIYVDSAMDGELLDSSALVICEELRKQGKEVYLAMPHIFRDRTRNVFQKRYASVLDSLFDGVLIRNLETIAFLNDCQFQGKRILDHNMYVFNHMTKEFWRQSGYEQYTAPLELNQQELRRLELQNGELIVYGYMPVMVSAQCVTNTTSGCKKKDGELVLKDRLQNTFVVKNHCRECYNVIYNSAPLYLMDLKEEVQELMCHSLRLQFTHESGKETEAILRDYCALYFDDQESVQRPEELTRGHFKRGII